MQSFEIRDVTQDDFDAWLSLWKGYQAFYEVDIPMPVTRKTWERFLDPAEPLYATLAVKDGEVVGLVHTIYHRSTWLGDDVCYLQDLFVAPGVRGAGVGRALIEHVYADAKNRGAPRVYWLTHETNHKAMKLYNTVADRSGFVQYRKTMNPL